MKNSLISIINTLNLIEVKGKDNMDMLLGCIMQLEMLVKLIDSNKDSTNNNTEQE